MAKRYLVIGLGRFGSALARSLAQRGCEVVAVDRDMAMVDAIKDRVGYAVQLDGSDPTALASVDASECQAALVCMGEGFEASVLTVAALKETGVRTIVARAMTARQGRILKAVGATRVIEVESEMGRRLGAVLASEKDVESAMDKVDLA